MRSSCLLIFLLSLSTFCYAQKTPDSTLINKTNSLDYQLMLDQLGENISSDADYFDLENEFQGRNDRPKRNLSYITEKELSAFGVLTKFQINQFFIHIQAFGLLNEWAELQSIEGWDPLTIQRMEKYSYVAVSEIDILLLRSRFENDDKLFSINRIKFNGLNQRGYSDSISADRQFKGSPFSLYQRIQYTFRNSWQFGLTAEKDAGEQFTFSNTQKGYDFYSGYVFWKPSDKLKVIAGDYLIQLGQGLNCYNGFALGKNSDIIKLIRNPKGILPYRSTNENIYQRGGAISYSINNNWQILAFGSHKNVDANVFETDSINNTSYFTSLNISGLHRNQSELNNRKTLSVSTFGTDVSYKKNNTNVGLSLTGGKFGKELVQNPYLSTTNYNNDTFGNASIHTDFSINNLRFFGEYAMDYKSNTAFLQGLTTILHPALELTLLYRRYEVDYYAPSGNSFSEGALPRNERGLYSGLKYLFSNKNSLSGYIDLFNHPGPKYRVNEPSQNVDYWLDWRYQPTKERYFYIRYRSSLRNRNSTNDADNKIIEIKPITKQYIRFHYQQPINDLFSTGSRVEISSVSSSLTKSNGLLIYQDINYQPNRLNKSQYISLRMLYYSIPTYDSRLFAYERDVMYNYNTQSFIGRGLRSYLIYYTKIGKINIQSKIGYTYYLDKGIENPYSLTQTDLNYNIEGVLQVMYRW